MARRHERVPYFVEVVLESASGRQQARISDLSTGGCFIDSIADIPVGDAVSFEIERPGSEPLRLSGEVRYRLPGIGLGVSFRDLTPEQRDFVISAAGSDFRTAA